MRLTLRCARPCSLSLESLFSRPRPGAILSLLAAWTGRHREVRTGQRPTAIYVPNVSLCLLGRSHRSRAWRRSLSKSIVNKYCNTRMRVRKRNKQRTGSERRELGQVGGNYCVYKVQEKSRKMSFYKTVLLRYS